VAVALEGGAEWGGHIARETGPAPAGFLESWQGAHQRWRARPLETERGRAHWGDL